VDDHDLVRLGLRTLVLSHAAALGCEVAVFEARSLQAAMELHRVRERDIGLVLLDLGLPDSRGLAGLKAYVEAFPSARIVVLSATADPAIVGRAAAIGAAAFLAKSADLQHVVEYIRSHGFFSDPGRQDGLQPAPAPSEAPREAGRVLWSSAGQRVVLSERQSQVLDWILAGHSNRQIAEATHLSEGTIKNHVSTLLLLFSVRSRAQLISQLR